MKKKPTLTRFEIIKELAKHAHPSWYHKLLGWDTEPLQMLLDYYEKPEDKGDYFIWRWPFGYTVNTDTAIQKPDGIVVDGIREELKNRMRFNDMRPKK